MAPEEGFSGFLSALLWLCAGARGFSNVSNCTFMSGSALVVPLGAEYFALATIISLLLEHTDKTQTRKRQTT